MLLQAESVTSCAAARRMAVTAVSCNLCAIKSRLLSFELHQVRVVPCAGDVATLAPRAGLATCSAPRRELRTHQCALLLVDELHCAELSTFSSAYGLVQVSSSTAADSAVALHVTRTCRL